MDKFRYMYSSKLMLDECERCGGIWVQDGELRRMREVLEEQKIPRGAAPKSVSVSQASKEKATIGMADRLRRVHQFIWSVGGQRA